MTASNAQAIATNGKGLKTYIYSILAKKYSCAESEGYSNEHIMRGHELEDYARSVYEMETGNEVEQVGFVTLGDYIGCSPDGLVGDDGGVEIKSLSDEKYMQYLLGDEIEKKYYWQIQMNLLVTGRQWWDLVVYNPNFKKTLYIKRYTPDLGDFEKLYLGLADGEQMLKDLTKKFEQLIA